MRKIQERLLAERGCNFKGMFMECPIKTVNSKVTFGRRVEGGNRSCDSAGEKLLDSANRRCKGSEVGALLVYSKNISVKSSVAGGE